MVATRRQEQMENALSAPDIRRSGRDRKPVKSLISMSELITKAKNLGGKSGNIMNKKGKNLPAAKGWAQIRKEQEKQMHNEKRRKTIPNTLTDPYTGDTVWIATATLQDIAIANKKHRPPWPLYQRYLIMVPSIQQRQIVYDRAAAAISELEERILPSYGGRLQWKCVVTIKENTAVSSANNNISRSKQKHHTNETIAKPRSKSNDSSNKKSPYFCWNARGQLELAAWPYMIEKIPNPPHFPGYYKNGKANVRNRSTKSSSVAKVENEEKINIMEKQSPLADCEDILLVTPVNDSITALSTNSNEADEIVVVEHSQSIQDFSIGRDTDTIVPNCQIIPTASSTAAMSNIVVDAVEPGNDAPDAANEVDVEQDNGVEDEGCDDDDDDDEEEELLSDDVMQLRELQDRAVTGLSELAYEERWRVSIPTIHYKWISPLQQTFYTRKSAWDHAIELCKNDLLLDKVLHGYGANGKMILPKLPTQSATFNAGKLRFIRDGLWIIGQEEQWIHERIQQEQNDENVESTIDSRIVDKHVGTSEQSSDKMTSIDTSVGNSFLVPQQQQRPWTGLSWFIHESRTRHRDKRLKEILPVGKSAIHVITPPPSKSKTSDTDSSSSLSTCTIEPATPTTLNVVTSVPTSEMLDTPQFKGENKPFGSDDISKYTLVEATKELRAIWKSMTEDEKNKWNYTATMQNAMELKSATSCAPVSPTSSATKLLDISKQSNKKKPLNVHRCKKWSLNEHQIQLCYDAGMEHYDQIMRTVTARDLFRELEDGFDLLRERGKGRWDMTLPEFDTSSYAFLNDTKKSPWMPVVREILGTDVVLIHKGIFLSMPGSNKQVYHQDGPHLTTQYQKPCHAINVFVPLVDLELDNGPTEFCLGSHFLGYDELDEDYVTIPTVSAGTPIIFDYRLGHRGLGNVSTSCRPIVYCTYAASADGKEFRDSVNFSRKRYHRIGDLVEKGLTRAERAEKRQRT